MKFTDIDEGRDLKPGDIVYIKYKVLEVYPEYPLGSAKVQFMPRNGKDEYAAKNIATVFMKRPKSKLLKWLVKLINA